MSKKNKHLIKLNNKIRNYFKGLTFEEGIQNVDEEMLVDLVMLLELPMKKLEHEEMVRALRRVWSEEGYKTRELIVSYLTQPYRAVPKGAPALSHTDKVEQILAFLEGTQHTRYEENHILESFIDMRPSKITKEKVLAKLSYLRHNERLQTLEKSLDVTFNTLNEMTFYESFTFSLENYDFIKKLLCVSEPVALESLWTKSDEEIENILKNIKQVTYQEKQASLEHFLAQLTAKPHPYLNEAQMMASLKRLSPEESFYHAPIEFKTVEEILHTISQKYHVHESTEHIIIEKDKSYELFGKMLHYTISVSYEKPLVYSFIWRGEELPVKEELSAVNEELIAHFNIAVDDVLFEMRQMCGTLKLPDKELEAFILRYTEAQVNSSLSLKFKEKAKRRILFHFGEHLKPLLFKQQREELLAKTIRDFKNLFPLARRLKRKIIFHTGPTNSGKTYAALQHLKAADTGYYLAPLRLLALEGYENLRDAGVHASLITGEEEIIDEESTHISSTIEMMNSAVDVQVCVIDEIQMIADRDRGWAWANALIGAPAKTVILTGSSDAVEAVTKLCEYLEEELEIIHFERKNELSVMQFPTSVRQIDPKTAVVAFSRREVLSLKQTLSEKYRVSVVYGNLSPEVRREEARRFREGETEILVATDAIAMGLNLPIKTILFAKDNKFDGLRRRELLPTEIKQIAGRAGRYGIEEKGYVGALDESTLYSIEKAFHMPLPDLKLPFSVMASLEHVMLIGEILETDNLLEILGFFADNMEFEGPFVAANIDSMLEIAAIVGEYTLDLKTRYYLACAPASISSPYIESVFHRYIRQIEAGQKVLYIPPRDLPSFAQTNDMLLNAEDRVREISLYLWLSFKFPGLFEDTDKAIEARGRLNRFIESSLQKGHFTKTCRKCGKVLDFSYRFSICDECYTQGKRGGMGTVGRGGYRGRKRR